MSSHTTEIYVKRNQLSAAQSPESTGCHLHPQSTTQQMTYSQESLKIQCALTQRATELGWPEVGIDVVDIDLGRSGATTEGRTGFQALVAQIAIG